MIAAPGYNSRAMKNHEEESESFILCITASYDVTFQWMPPAEDVRLILIGDAWSKVTIKSSTGVLLAIWLRTTDGATFCRSANWRSVHSTAARPNSSPVGYKYTSWLPLRGCGKLGTV